MYFSLILLGLFLTHVPLSEGACPVAPGAVEDFKDACRLGAIRVGTQCLLFNSSSLFYYEDGKRFCEEMEGGILAPFNPQTIQALRDTNLSSVDMEWTYVIDLRGVDSYFLSPNGQRVFINDSQWNSARGHPQETTDCAKIYVTYEGETKLRSHKCYYDHYVICQTSGKTCAEGELRVNDKCLLFVEEERYYYQTASLCAEQGPGYEWLAYDRLTIQALLDIPSLTGVSEGYYAIQLRRPHVSASGQVVTWEHPLWAPGTSDDQAEPFPDKFDCVALNPSLGYQIETAICEEIPDRTYHSGVVCEVT